MTSAPLAADDAVPPHDVHTPAWPGREVVVDGTVTFVRDTPARAAAAEPALFVHGLGGSSQNWTDLAALLADRLDGQAIDLPGFGRSEPGRRYSIAEFAHRVVRWIEHTDRGPVHLFGNSLGGAVSVRVAALRPDLVRTLTLVSPAMPFLDPRRSVQGRLVPLLMLPRAHRLAARRMAAVEPAVMARMVIEACFADPSRFPGHRMVEAVEDIALRSTVPWYADAYVRTMRGLVTSFLRAYLPGSESLWRMAARVSAPTLVVGGTHDRLVDTRVAARVAEVIRDSRLLMLDGVGHVAQMEEPRTVARAVIPLLESARRTDAPESAGRHGRANLPSGR